MQAEAFVNGNQMQMQMQMAPGGFLGVPGWPPVGNFNAPMSTEETDMIGIMGEHFVRRSLSTVITSHLTIKMTNLLLTPVRKGIQSTQSPIG